MMQETILDKYNTTFGTVIVISTKHPYRIGDSIRTNDGNYQIKQVIMPTRPVEKDVVSFVVD